MFLSAYWPASGACANGKSEPAELVLSLDGDSSNLTKQVLEGCLLRCVVEMTDVVSGEDLSGLNMFIGAAVGDGIWNRTYYMTYR